MPKWGNPHGNGSLIVGMNAVKFIHTEVEKSNSTLKLKTHVGRKSLGELLSYDENGRCTNALNVLSDPTVLETAYHRIKYNPGNMTPGIDKETLDGIDRA